MSSLSFRMLDEANADVVQGINRLLRILHSKSKPLTVMDLANNMTMSRIFVAEGFGVIVGLLVLSPNYALTHVSGFIHNMITDDAEAKAVYRGLVDVVTAHAKQTMFQFLVLHLNKRRDDAPIIQEVFTEAGFKERDYVDYRLVL